jgi:dihydrofolate reductase
MTKLVTDLSVSLDGYVAGPSPSLEQPLGEGGERLHEWALALESWRRPHGLEGGVTNASSAVVEEMVAGGGAFLMGRRMFSGGEGPWEDDPKANGWWGEEPPFHAPVFVLTHHEREPLELQGGTTFTFVTEGIEAAHELARQAAGEKDVVVAGGASLVQQYLAAGLLDELNVDLVPILLGGGTRLLDGPSGIELECVRVVGSEGVTHLRYRVSR